MLGFQNEFTEMGYLTRCENVNAKTEVRFQNDTICYLRNYLPKTNRHTLLILKRQPIGTTFKRLLAFYYFLSKV